MPETITRIQITRSHRERSPRGWACRNRAEKMKKVGRGASVPRSHRGRRPQTLRLNPVGFSFALSGRGDLLALSFRPLLSRCDRLLRPGKSSGPTLFAPSLKVQRDDTHNPPPTKAFNTHCALKGPGRVRDKSADTGRNRSERPQKKKPGHRGLPGGPIPMSRL